MNAAELALLADPKALLAYASSIVNLILNNDISPDVVVDTPLAAHHAPVEVADTTQSDKPTPVKDPVERITIRHLGNSPVAVDPDGSGPKTAIEQGFDGNDTDASKENDSAIIDSAREVAKLEGLNEQQTEELMQKMAADKDRFIAASKVDGYSDGGVSDTKVQKGDYGMGSNSGAQKVTLDLENPENAVTKTYTLSDGTKVTVTVADKCANPMMKVVPPEPAPVAAPAEKVCEAPTKKIYEYTGSEVKNEDGTPLTKEEKNLVINKGEKVGVVKIDNMRPEDLWQDHDKDGNGVESCADSPVGRQWDEDEMGKQEILPGITPEQVKADFDAFEKQNGYRPKFLIYDVTDCDGRNIVACWNEEEGKWSFVYPREDGVPVDADGKPAYEKRGVPSRSKWVKVGEPYVIDTHKKLMDYLNQPVPVEVKK